MRRAGHGGGTHRIGRADQGAGVTRLGEVDGATTVATIDAQNDTITIVSDGGTRPYRVHYRDPSFTNLQAVAAMCEGGQIADVIAAVASIDPVMGGVDR